MLHDKSQESADWQSERVAKNKRWNEGMWFEIWRDRIMDFHFYVMYTGVSSFLVAFFIRIYFLISFVIMGLLPCHPMLWNDETLFRKVVVVASHFVFFKSRIDHPALMWMSVGLICAIILVGILFVFSTLRHQVATAKRYPLIDFFSIFTLILPTVLQFFAAHVGISIGLIVSGQRKAGDTVVAVCLAVIFVALCGGYVIFASPELLFRPRILTFYSPSHGSLLFVLYYLFIIFSVVGSIAQSNGLCYVSAIPVLVMVGFLFSGLVGPDWKIINSFTAVSVVVFLEVIIQASFAVSRHGNIDWLVMLFGSGIFILKQVLDALKERSLERARPILDDLRHCKEIDDVVGNMGRLKTFELLAASFESHHKICHSLYLLEAMLLKYSNSYFLWITYLRIQLCYYGRNAEHTRAYHSVLAFRHKIYVWTASSYVFQRKMILKVRNLDGQGDFLKSLRRIMRQSDHCRSIMRLLWERIFLGDMSLCENYGSLLRRSIEEVQEQFLHLLTIYPNNPLVAEKYSAFFADVLGDKDSSTKWRKTAELLKKDNKADQDSTRFTEQRILGEILDLSCSDYACNPNDQLLDPLSTRGATEVQSTARDSEQEQNSKRLLILIQNYKAQSMVYLPTVVIFIVSVLAPLAVLVPYWYSQSRLQEEFTIMNVGIEGSCLSALAGRLLTLGTVYPLMYFGTHPDFKSCYEMLYVPKALYPATWGDSLELDHIVGLMVDEFREAISLYVELMTNLPTSSHTYESVVGNFYSQKLKVNLSKIVDETTYFKVMIPDLLQLSVQGVFQYFVSFVLSSQVLVRVGDVQSFMPRNEVKFLFNNSEEMFNHLVAYESIVENSVIESGTRESQTLLFMSIGLSAVMVVMILILWVVKLRLIDRDISRVIAMFGKTPRYLISDVIQQLSRTSETDELSAEKMVDAKRQKDVSKELIIDSTHGHLTDRSVVSVVVLILICTVVIVGIVGQWGIYNSQSASVYRSLPMLFHLSRMHSGLTTVVHQIVAILYFNSQALDEPLDVPKQRGLEALDQILRDLNEFRHGTKIGYYQGLFQLFPDFSRQFTREICDSRNISRSYLESLTLYVERPFYLDNQFLCASYETSLTEVLQDSRRWLSGEILMLMEDHIVSKELVWLFSNSYEQAIKPSKQYLLNVINQQFYGHMRKRLILVVVCVLLLVILGVGYVLYIKSKMKTAYTLLRMLMFCDATELISNPQLVRALSCDFTRFKVFHSIQDEYEKVVGEMSEPVIICDSEGYIKAFNQVTPSIFGENLLDSHVTAVITAPAFERTFNNVKKRRAGLPFEMHVSAGGTTYKVIGNAIAKSGKFVYSMGKSDIVVAWCFIFRDLSLDISKNKRLLEERDKLRRLKASVLHPVITRAFECDANIVFKAPSCSVASIELVGLQELANSAPVEQVMATMTAVTHELQNYIGTKPNVAMFHMFRNVFTVVSGIFDRVVHVDENITNAMLVCRHAMGFIEDWSNSNRVPMQVRCAVAVGTVVAGLVEDEARTFNCLGDPVELTNKMLGMTPPGALTLVEDAHVGAINIGFRVHSQMTIEWRNKQISILGTHSGQSEQ